MWCREIPWDGDVREDGKDDGSIGKIIGILVIGDQEFRIDLGPVGYRHSMHG